jgi:hypothetical protein
MYNQDKSKNKILMNCFMTRAKNTLLTYIILILLAAALIASGKLISSLKSAPTEKSDAEKLAELRAELMQAAKAGNKQQPASSNTSRTSTRRSPKARPT